MQGTLLQTELDIDQLVKVCKFAQTIVLICIFGLCLDIDRG